MSLAAFIRMVPEGAILSIKAQPRASRNEITGIVGTELKIRTTAPPVDSAANHAILTFLAVKLNLPPRCVSLLRGTASRQKKVLIQGLSPSDIVARLGL